MKHAEKEALKYEGKFFRPSWNIATAKEIQIFKRERGIPDIVTGRRENAMELYTQHDIGPILNHFHNKNSDEFAFKNNLANALNHCLTKQQQENVFSIFSDDEDDDYKDEGLDKQSYKSSSTVVRMLEKLKDSPTKKSIKTRKPLTLKGLQKPIFEQLEPFKVRIQSNPKGRALIVVDKQAHDLLRVPLRLHELFEHHWTF